MAQSSSGLGRLSFQINDCGSNPHWATKYGEVPERQKESMVNWLATVFGGSSPTLSHLAHSSSGS